MRSHWPIVFVDAGVALLHHFLIVQTVAVIVIVTSIAVIVDAVDEAARGGCAARVQGGLRDGHVVEYAVAPHPVNIVQHDEADAVVHAQRPAVRQDYVAGYDVGAVDIDG